MPIRDFQRDIVQAATPGRYSRLAEIKAGEIDGSIAFTFIDAPANVKIDFQAIVPGEYYNFPS